MDNTMTRALVAATALILTACGGSSLPSNLSTASTANSASATPLSLSTNGLTSLYDGGTLQMYVSGGQSPYVFTQTGGSVNSTTFIYSAPTVAGVYTVTVTDQLGATQSVSLNVVDQTATTTTTTTTTTTATTTSKVVWRAYNAGNQMHSFSDQQADTQGGVLEGPVYLLDSVNDAGTVAFLRCALAVPYRPGQFVDTTQSNCEGYPSNAIYTLGYIYTAQNAAGTLLPLYRWRVDFYSTSLDSEMVDHIDTTVNQAPGSGWVLDGVVGYVPAQ